VQAQGLGWQGASGDALTAHTFGMHTAATGVSDAMRGAATIAREGASNLTALASKARYAIEDAQADGFTVGEDLSVSDARSNRSPVEQAARQAQAETHAGNIVRTATALWTHDAAVGGDMTNATAGIQAVDNKWGKDPSPTPQPANSQPSVDPRNPFVGDERFGHWENVVPPPYVGKDPPPPWTGHRSLEGFPGKGPAGPSGFYVPDGKTWADDNAPPFAYLQEQYRFRISGEDYTSYTRTVDGHQQQWVQYTYDAQRYTQVSFGGDAWAPQGPNEITKEPGGVISGGLAGLNPPPKIDPWHPVTLPQMGTLSAANPNVTYYIPNGCGGQFTFTGGVPAGGTQPPPRLPSIIAAP
jgi:hypothetical protein